MPIRNVRDAMHELGHSPHIQSRAQAVAVGLKAQRTGRTIGGRKALGRAARERGERRR
jgi:hypothetical protein